jgi:hypothetical protein
MHQFILSTEHFHIRHQFAYWREECVQRRAGMTAERGGNKGSAGTMLS